MRPRLLASTALGLLVVLSASVAPGQPASDAPPSPLDNREVRTTILRGTPPPLTVPAHPVVVLENGDISLNFPKVDVQAVATAVLSDTLGVPFTISPDLHNLVTVQTPHPIRRADVLSFLEGALTQAGLVLTNRSGAYSIMPANLARGEAPVVGPNDPGFGNESIELKFVNAEEMRKLLDPLVPDAISVADPTRNVLVVSGNSTQRRALRELVAEFDVDWLKGMSFALFIPQRTDAGLIAPELDKLLNAPGAPSAGLVRLIAMDRLNGILAITSQAQYLDDTRRFVEILDREGEGAERRVFVYHVQNSRAADLAKVLNAAFGNASSGSARTDTDATSLTDHTAPSPATLPPAAGAQGQIGGPQYGQAGAISPRAGVSQAALDATPGQAQATSATGGGTTITADETNNAIVVFSTPRDYALIADALTKLDVPPLQVMIDASISEVTLNHNLQYGIEWAFQSGRLGGIFSSGTQTATTTTTGGVPVTVDGVTSTTPTNTVTTLTPPTPQQFFPGLSFLYAGNGISATLNALRTVADVTVLSAPKLMVLNNHTATIEVGNQVPISTGSATSTITSSAPIVNSIEYRDTGVILKVTPRVNSGGLVLLDIAQEVSDVLPQSSSQASSQDASPTIEQRKIATSVAVQDGQTVALGGLIQNEVQKNRTTIPLLGNIPYIGHLFGDTSNALMRTELVVLLTPRVVRTPVDARAVTEELREKIHLAAPPPRPPKPKINAP